MLLIRCPYCEMERPEIEFKYAGEAHLARPRDPAAASDEEWSAFLYFRANDKGPHAERWRHASGCGRYFNCLRDTVSDRISATYKAGEARPGACVGGAEGTAGVVRPPVALARWDAAMDHQENALGAVVAEPIKRAGPEGVNAVPRSRGTIIAAPTLGEAWLDVARLILAEGAPGSFDGLPLLEVELVTLDISEPDPDDALIARYASREWLAWMRANFTDRSRVAELGDARSYASRLFDYAGSGRDQLAGVVDTLTRDPAASYATITTFEPLTDTSYIPCVSLLDFWLRSGRLELVVYAHSIDFGKKGFGNLVQLAQLQRHVAARLGAATGRLAMIVKSATICKTEVGLMRETLAKARPGAV